MSSRTAAPADARDWSRDRATARRRGQRHRKGGLRPRRARSTPASSRLAARPAGCAASLGSGRPSPPAIGAGARALIDRAIAVDARAGCLSQFARGRPPRCGRCRRGARPHFRPGPCLRSALCRGSLQPRQRIAAARPPRRGGRQLRPRSGAAARLSGSAVQPGPGVASGGTAGGAVDASAGRWRFVPVGQSRPLSRRCGRGGRGKRRANAYRQAWRRRRTMPMRRPPLRALEERGTGWTRRSPRPNGRSPAIPAQLRAAVTAARVFRRQGRPGEASPGCGRSPTARLGVRPKATTRPPWSPSSGPCCMTGRATRGLLPLSSRPTGRWRKPGGRRRIDRAIFPSLIARLADRFTAGWVAGWTPTPSRRTIRPPRFSSSGSLARVRRCSTKCSILIRLGDDGGEGRDGRGAPHGRGDAGRLSGCALTLRRPSSPTCARHYRGEVGRHVG